METARKCTISEGNSFDVGGNLNKYLQNNSVQMAGQDNEVTYVQGYQNDAGSDTINNSGGGQVTIIKQHFQLDYSGFQGNTVPAYPLLNHGNHGNHGMYPMTLAPRVPSHLLPINLGGVTHPSVPTGFPHLCRPDIHPHQFNHHPMYPFGFSNGVQISRDGSFLFEPLAVPQAFPPLLSYALPIPILAPIPSHMLMPVQTSRPASAAVQMQASHNVNEATNLPYPPHTRFGCPTQDGTFDHMYSPSYHPALFHPQHNQTHPHGLLSSETRQARLQHISDSSTEVIPLTPLELCSPTPNQLSTSTQCKDISTFFNLNTPVPAGPHENQVQMTLDDRPPNLSALSLQKGAEQERLSVESLTITPPTESRNEEEPDLAEVIKEA